MIDRPSAYTCRCTQCTSFETSNVKKKKKKKKNTCTRLKGVCVCGGGGGLFIIKFKKNKINKIKDDIKWANFLS